MKKFTDLIIKRQYILPFLFLTLTFSMIWVSHHFYVNDLIFHPQFERIELLNDPTFYAAINKVYFVSFFVLDFFWAGFLLLFLENYTFSVCTKKYNNWILGLSCFSIFIITLLLDYSENLLYISQYFAKEIYPTFFKKLILIKKIAFGVSFGIAFIAFIADKMYKKIQLSTIGDFVKNSFTSILLIVLLLILLTQMAQGSVLIVDLLHHHPISFLLTVFFIGFMSLIVGHYPVYFEHYRNSKRDKKDQPYWIVNNSFQWWGFGVIYYVPRTRHDTPDENEQNDTDNSSKKNDTDEQQNTYNPYDQKAWIQTGRRLLGIFVYVMWIYVLLFCWKKYFILHIDLPGVILIIGLFYWWYYIHVAQKKVEIKEQIKGLNQNITTAVKKKIKTFNRFYEVGIVMTFLLALLAAFFIKINGWSTSTLALVLATTFAQAFTYIHFILGRSLFVYSHYKDTALHKALERNTYLISKEKEEKEKEDKPTHFWHLGNFSNNAFYVESFRIAGVILLIFLLFVNICIQQTLAWNPTPILFAYLILAYSLVTIAIKHLMYYRQEVNDVKDISNDNTIRQQYHYFIKIIISIVVTIILLKILPCLIVGLILFLGFLADFFIFKSHKRDKHLNTIFWKTYHNYLKITIPILLAIVPLGFLLDNYIDNDLHTIPMKKENNEFLSFEEFKDNFEQKNQNPNIYVSSFGGGLKANFWTLLILNELEKKCHHKFLEQTVAMSGVSGGGVGLATYAALSQNFSNQDSIQQRIYNIGGSHVLSIDGAYFLGWDFVREIIPKQLGTQFNGQDRAYEKMLAYNSVIQNDVAQNGFMKQTFRDYWCRLYEQKRSKNSLFPALLINTISTHSQYGVASSVKIKEEDFFPGAIDILTYQNDSSLTFSGAVSTTNRFPIFSPTARITQKGNFLDGGYFENSGLLSLMHFRKLMNTNKQDRKQDVIVSIINSKEQYIGYLLEKLHKQTPLVVNEFPSSELGAIVKTLADTDSWPNTLSQQIEYDFQGTSNAFIKIYLPHYIYYHEVESVLKGYPSDDDSRRIMKAITKSNDQIINALNVSSTYNCTKWGISEPALARLLSQSDVEYQKSMVECHYEVREQLERILHSANLVK